MQRSASKGMLMGEPQEQSPRGVKLCGGSHEAFYLGVTFGKANGVSCWPWGFHSKQGGLCSGVSGKLGRVWARKEPSVGEVRLDGVAGAL